MCPSGTRISQKGGEGGGADPNLLVCSDFMQAFEVLDTDHDGKISRDDLHNFYQKFSSGGGGGAAFDDIIGTMMSVADSNKDGFVEYDEFERVLNGNHKEKSTQTPPPSGLLLQDVFRVMDKDGDGLLSHEDLKSYMKWAGFSATDGDINAMIRLAGADSMQGVSFDGLLKILAIDNVGC